MSSYGRFRGCTAPGLRKVACLDSCMQSARKPLQAQTMGNSMGNPLDRNARTASKIGFSDLVLAYGNELAVFGVVGEDFAGLKFVDPAM